MFGLGCSHPVSAGVHGVLPVQPEEQAWTGALSLDRAAHRDLRTARCGEVLCLELRGPPYLLGCHNTQNTILTVKAEVKHRDKC